MYKAFDTHRLTQKDNTHFNQAKKCKTSDQSRQQKRPSFDPMSHLKKNNMKMTFFKALKN